MDTIEQPCPPCPAATGEPVASKRIRWRAFVFVLCFLALLHGGSTYLRVQEITPEKYGRQAIDLRETAKWRFGFIAGYHGAYLVKTPHAPDSPPVRHPVPEEADLASAMAHDLETYPAKSALEAIFYLVLMAYAFFLAPALRIKLAPQLARRGRKILFEIAAWSLGWTLACLPLIGLGYGGSLFTTWAGPGAWIYSGPYPGFITGLPAETISYRPLLEAASLLPLAAFQTTGLAGCFPEMSMGLAVWVSGVLFGCAVVLLAGGARWLLDLFKTGRALGRPNRWLGLWAAALLLAARPASAQLRLTSFSIEKTRTFPPSSGNGYSNAPVATSNGVEHRLFLNGHHFATIVDQQGTFNIRMHPGVDRNGWGSSLYLQPFLNDADVVLGHSSIAGIDSTATGIFVHVGGFVSSGTNGTYGAWSIADLEFTYDPETKTARAQGLYSLELDGPLSTPGRDLNLFRIASNYLMDVPLLDGTTNDTGDMASALLIRNGQTTNVWNPRDGDTFPTDMADRLAVEVVGRFNDVDAPMQTWTNFPAIQAATKPSLRVELTADEAGWPLICGCMYDETQSQLFFADNVGITPVIACNPSFTRFAYSIDVLSSALPGDGTGLDAELAAVFYGENPPAQVEAYYLEACDGRLKRVVGTLPAITSNQYAGSVEIPFENPPPPVRGFFRLSAP